MSPEIVVYSAPGCHRCQATVRYLDRAQVDYRYVDITEDPPAADHLTLLGYGPGDSLPVVTCGDMHHDGFRPDRLGEYVRLLESSPDTGHLEADAVAELTEDGAA